MQAKKNCGPTNSEGGGGSAPLASPLNTPLPDMIMGNYLRAPEVNITVVHVFSGEVYYIRTCYCVIAIKRE